MRDGEEEEEEDDDDDDEVEDDDDKWTSKLSPSGAKMKREQAD